ncbi:hypothetical protein SLA2020_287520 [Shorea laevis]
MYGPIRNRSYIEAVENILGRGHGRACFIITELALYATGIAYAISSIVNILALLHSVVGASMLLGLVHIILSQIPDFHNIRWLSVTSALLALAISMIGLFLGLLEVLENGHVKGSIAGVTTGTFVEKVWLTSQSVGNIAFVFPFSLIVFEIQDALTSPPPENVTMKRASLMSVFTITFLYMICGGCGYVAFGDYTPQYLFSGFHGPYWLISIANVCMAVLLIGGYQLYSHPLYVSIERLIRETFPGCTFIGRNLHISPPHVLGLADWLPTLQLSWLSLLVRLSFVLGSLCFAAILPQSSQVVGLLGNIDFWPLCIYFPVEMYIQQMRIASWTRTWVLLQIYSIIFLVIYLYILVGAIGGLSGLEFLTILIGF